ncbi:MAG: hypothetical protein ACTHNP_02015 [Solirubrobacterales bacterium]
MRTIKANDSAPAPGFDSRLVRIEQMEDLAISTPSELLTARKNARVGRQGRP